jgi:glutamate carboxypeptidase
MAALLVDEGIAGAGGIMPDHPTLAAAARFVAPFLDDLRALVDIDSGTYTPAGVARVAEYLRPRYAELGCDVELRSGRELGPLLLARRRGNGGPRVLLIGHMDTVFPEGEAGRRPFRVADGRACGPGVLDMKAGLLAGLYALRLLGAAGEAPYGALTIVCNPDEEVGSPESGPLIRELAGEADAAIVLEPGRAPDAVTVARKGVGGFTLAVRGVAAHAGTEPEKGRNAILELAHRIVALQAINGTIDGVTVNVGTVAGGERPTVVPEEARAGIDVRAPSAAAMRAVEEALRRAAAERVVPDVEVRLSGGFVHLPFEQSAASARLFALARDEAAGLGIELRGVATGGGSDGNTTAAAGVATLDGMGPSGGLAHNPGEWVAVATIPTRVALLAGVLRRLGAGWAPREEAAP